MNKSGVLFLCTGNSCRSQIAEALVNVRFSDRWKAFSAGSRPAGKAHPLAIKVLAELGIDHQGKPKSIQEFLGQSFDLVVTLCDDSDADCPVWLGKGKQLHRPFPDPAKVTGSEDEKLQAFRQSRDDIDAELTRLLNN